MLRLLLGLCYMNAAIVIGMLHQEMTAILYASDLVNPLRPSFIVNFVSV